MRSPSSDTDTARSCHGVFYGFSGERLRAILLFRLDPLRCATPPSKGLRTLMTLLRRVRVRVSIEPMEPCPNGASHQEVNAAQSGADAGQIEMDSPKVSCNALLAKSVDFKVIAHGRVLFFPSIVIMGTSA